MAEASSTPAPLSSALASVWESQRPEVMAFVDELDDGVAALVEGRLDPEQRRTVARVAHRLAGSLGTFGFARAGQAARRLESILEDEAQLQDEQILEAANELLALRDGLEGGPVGADVPASEAAAPGVDQGGDGEATAGVMLALADEALHERLATELTGRGWTSTTDLPSAAAPGASGRDPDRPDGDAHAAPATVAVVDLGLPDDEALHLITRVARARPDVPLLALTPDDGFADRVAAARAGAWGFLPRTASLAVLCDMIEGLVERSRPQRSTVLVVDDDPGVVAEIVTALESDRLRVIGVEDPREAWEVLEREEPDLLILDLVMPHVTGQELIRVIRGDPRWAGLPVLVLTARQDTGAIAEVFAAGADDFVVKPLAGPELRARVDSRIERTRLIKAMTDTDALTGLPRRSASHLDLRRLLELAERRDQPLAFAVLDVDRLKTINERHGHSLGDEVLRRLSDLLSRAFRGDDQVAHWGGDEIVVAAPGMDRDDGVQRVASALERFREEVFLTPSGTTISASFSAGVAVFPHDATRLSSLYTVADGALGLAKRRGRDRVLGAVSTAPSHPVDLVIVEDDRPLVELLGHALTTRGYRWRHLDNGSDAVDQLADDAGAQAAPLVLLDVDLPGLDGVGVLRRMAATGALQRTRVIMLTSRSGEREVVEALSLGAFDHVAKPFSVPVLMQRIRRALAY